MNEIFTIEYLTQHWFGILIALLITGIILWRWSQAGKDAATGPVAYAIKKHQFAMFGIGIITILIVGIFIAFGGPYLGKFFFWTIKTTVANTERVVIQDGDIATAAPSSTQASPTNAAGDNTTILPTPTYGAASTTTGTACYKITSDATARTEANSTAPSAGDGTIEAGLIVKTDQQVDSNTVGNSNQRARLLEAAGGVPAGSWFHLAVAQEVSCP